MQTPPQGRQAIKTEVLAYSEKNYKKNNRCGIGEKRAGLFPAQPRPDNWEESDEIKKLCPRAKVSSIHGRIPEKKLIKIMDDFQKEITNVLVATTIIENGLDLPNVNTIIIEDSTRLGLSQSHQIRGRVGRSGTKSFAYFMYNKNPWRRWSKKDWEHWRIPRNWERDIGSQSGTWN